MDSEALRAIRIYHDMTQLQFAAALGVSKSCVTAVEAGYRKVSDKLRTKVAQRFGMSENIRKAIDDSKTSAMLPQ